MNRLMRRIGLVVVALCIIVAIAITAFRNNWTNCDYSDYKIHISVDDTGDIFSDLTANENKYDSIFDNPTLAFCKKMHDDYGAVFSFYVFGDWEEFQLANSTNRFRNEFSENSEWLRFNYHAYDSHENLNTIDLTVFKKNYDCVMTSLIDIVSENAIDNATRLSMFSGSKAVMVRVAKDTPIFYTADDNRNSYYFNEQISKQIFIDGEYTEDGMLFIKTDLRLDNTEMPILSIHRLLSNDSDRRIEVFTHEWLMNQGGLKSQSIWKIREVCRYAFYHHMQFGFD